MTLAPFAVDVSSSAGRRVSEPPPRWRDEFQRDRDRIIHCSAFRRLEYKTQVFVNHEGDMFRTRLTHSLEVAQIARSIARALGLNEDLTEAIALAHDLGHTPFGHAGQKALNQCMRPFGGFEHNLHSLRIVDRLERRYPEFCGLNLMFETREGILKTCRADHARELGPLGERFLSGGQPSLEAQIANLADEIAYNHHDIDDGLRSGILEPDDLAPHPLFASALAESNKQYPDAEPKRILATTIRAMLGEFVNDLIAFTRRRLGSARCTSVEDVRACPDSLVAFSDDLALEHRRLKRILRRKLYNNERVRAFNDAAAQTVRELFEVFITRPQLLPVEDSEWSRDEDVHARLVADYIAGMTDRFAIQEHRRLVQIERWPRDWSVA